MDFKNPQIRQVFDNFPYPTKQALLTIRQWVLKLPKAQMKLPKAQVKSLPKAQMKSAKSMNALSGVSLVMSPAHLNQVPH